MSFQTYNVTCKVCSGERTIRIHDTAVGGRIDWLEDRAEPRPAIISGRQRLDNNWGFQCACGNNDLLTAQETKSFSNPANPSPQELDQVVSNLRVDQPRFEMVTV